MVVCVCWGDSCCRLDPASRPGLCVLASRRRSGPCILFYCCREGLDQAREGALAAPGLQHEPLARAQRMASPVALAAARLRRYAGRHDARLGMEHRGVLSRWGDHPCNWGALATSLAATSSAGQALARLGASSSPASGCRNSASLRGTERSDRNLNTHTRSESPRCLKR